MKSVPAMNETSWRRMIAAIASGTTLVELCKDFGFIRTQLVWQALGRNFEEAKNHYSPDEIGDFLHYINKILHSPEATMVSVGKVFKVSQGVGHRAKPFVNWEHTILLNYDSGLQNIGLNSMLNLLLDFREGKSPRNRLDLCEAVRAGILRDEQDWLKNLIRCRLVSLTVQVTPVLEADLWSDSYSLCVWDKQAS